MRGKLNLTIHPEIRAFAEELANKRRRSISHLFEELIEAEWLRRQGLLPQQPQGYPQGQPAPQAPQPAPAAYGQAPQPVPNPYQQPAPNHLG